MKLTISKRSAAKSEIDAAIRELGHGNYPSVELLAHSAIDVMSAVAKDSQVNTLSAQMKQYIRPEHRKDVERTLRKPYNFMKHSDRDKNTAIDAYDPEAAVMRVYFALMDYNSIWGSFSVYMVVFIAWFNARYPQMLKEDQVQVAQKLKTIFGDMSNSSLDFSVKVLKKQVNDMMEVAPELLARQRSDVDNPHAIEL